MADDVCFSFFIGTVCIITDVFFPAMLCHANETQNTQRSTLDCLFLSFSNQAIGGAFPSVQSCLSLISCELLGNTDSQANWPSGMDVVYGALDFRIHLLLDI